VLQSQTVTEIDIESLLESVRLPGIAGHRALGRLIRLIDDKSPESGKIDSLVRSSVYRAARIGLTGPPGAGKSSLISASLQYLTLLGKKVGILAVDPTSPFTGGAILGDRVRLSGPVTDNVFFRSLASRGEVGGVSRAIWPSSRLLDWWGADIIIIETVGSGQLGTGVMDVADVVVAVLTPEAGDGIQSMKAGVMELADCFVVNKSDRPGADLIGRELNMLKTEAENAGRSLEVFQTSAVNTDGIDNALDGIRDMWNRLNDSGQIHARRLKQAGRELATRVEAKIEETVKARLGGESEFEKTIASYAEQIMSGEITPGDAAKNILGD